METPADSQVANSDIRAQVEDFNRRLAEHQAADAALLDGRRAELRATERREWARQRRARRHG